MDRWRRLFAVGLLVVLTAGLCVHYGATYEDGWPHPTGNQLTEDPGGWDGERVLLIGAVEERTESGLVMTVEDDAGEQELTITVHDASVAVEPGGTVQVYGELSQYGTVQNAESVVVVNESPADHLYKLGTSIVGVLLTAGLFLRYWRIDWRQLRFVQRSGGEQNG